MYCYKHTDRQAVGACTHCGHLICEECKLEINGKFMCKDCVSSLAQNQAPQRVSRAEESRVEDKSLKIIKILCVIILIYSGYTLLTSLFGYAGLIFEKIFPVSMLFNILLRLVGLGGSIAYCAIKLSKPKTGHTPAIIVLAVNLLASLYSNINYLIVFKRAGIRQPILFQIRNTFHWYFLPVMLLAIILVEASARRRQG